MVFVLHHKCQSDVVLGEIVQQFTYCFDSEISPNFTVLATIGAARNFMSQGCHGPFRCKDLPACHRIYRVYPAVCRPLRLAVELFILRTYPISGPLMAIVAV